MRPTPYNSQIVSEKKNQISQSVLILEKNKLCVWADTKKS